MLKLTENVLISTIYATIFKESASLRDIKNIPMQFGDDENVPVAIVSRSLLHEEHCYSETVFYHKKTLFKTTTYLKSSFSANACNISILSPSYIAVPFSANVLVVNGGYCEKKKYFGNCVEVFAYNGTALNLFQWIEYNTDDCIQCIW